MADQPPSQPTPPDPAPPEPGTIERWRERSPDVPWTAMIPGAILMTAGLIILRLVTIVYFARRLESADDLYGGLGLAAVFLAWLYIIGRTLVASISLNPTLWRARRPSEDAP